MALAPTPGHCESGNLCPWLFPGALKNARTKVKQTSALQANLSQAGKKVIAQRPCQTNKHHILSHIDYNVNRAPSPVTIRGSPSRRSLACAPAAINLKTFLEGRPTTSSVFRRMVAKVVWNWPRQGSGFPERAKSGECCKNIWPSQRKFGKRVACWAK